MATCCTSSGSPCDENGVGRQSPTTSPADTVKELHAILYNRSTNQDILTFQIELSSDPRRAIHAERQRLVFCRSEWSARARSNPTRRRIDEVDDVEGRTADRGGAAGGRRCPGGHRGQRRQDR